MGRYSLDLTDISDTRFVAPAGVYETRLGVVKISKGISSDKSKNPGEPWTRLSLTLIIKDPEIIKASNMDEPKVFWSGMFSFDKEGKFLKDNSPEIGTFIKVVEVTNISDFEDGTENCESEREYICRVFENIGDAVTGMDILATVIQKAHHEKKGVVVNEVSSIGKIEIEE